MPGGAREGPPPRGVHPPGRRPKLHAQPPLRARAGRGAAARPNAGGPAPLRAGWGGGPRPRSGGGVRMRLSGRLGVRCCGGPRQRALGNPLSLRPNETKAGWLCGGQGAAPVGGARFGRHREFRGLRRRPGHDRPEEGVRQGVLRRSSDSRLPDRDFRGRVGVAPELAARLRPRHRPGRQPFMTLLQTFMVASLPATGMCYAVLGALKLPLAERLQLNEAKVGGLVSSFGFMVGPIILLCGFLADSLGRKGVWLTGSALVAVSLFMLARTKKYSWAVVAVGLLSGGWAADRK